jgi:DNA-binding MarR family transcriptional regulator
MKNTNVLELGRAIKQLQNLNHRRLETGLHEVSTTLAQWDALRAIDNNPHASAHALAEETFQTDQSFGTLATRLIEKGFVARQQGVGRALVHSLTPKGRSVLEQGLRIASRINDDSFRSLSELERAQLLALVRKALTNDGMEKKPSPSR